MKIPVILKNNPFSDEVESKLIAFERIKDIFHSIYVSNISVIQATLFLESNSIQNTYTKVPTTGNVRSRNFPKNLLHVELFHITLRNLLKQ